MKSAARAVLATLLFLTGITHAPTVQAQDARACAEAFETSQVTERDGDADVALVVAPAFSGIVGVW